jgi:hypothetical protein
MPRYIPLFSVFRKHRRSEDGESAGLGIRLSAAHPERLECRAIYSLFSVFRKHRRTKDGESTGPGIRLSAAHPER